MGNRWRGAAFALGGALLAVAVLGSGAAAGASPLDVRFATSQGNCVEGRSNKQGLTVQLRSSSGQLIQAVLATHEGGSFRACFDRGPRSGEKVRAVFGPETVSFTIPTLTVKAHRVSDVVTGKGPAGKQLRVRLYDCDRTTPDCVRRVTRSVTVEPNGSYRRDFTSLFDARGFDEARVTYEASAGHTHTVTRVFPWMVAILGDDRLFGEINPDQQSTFKLRATPGGTVLASRSRTATSTGVDFSFRFGRVIEPGQQVTGTFADDAKLTVWPVLITVTFKDDDQFINGTCLPNRMMHIEWRDGRRSVLADGVGKAFVNLSIEEQEGYRLFDGARLEVSCQNAKGDGVVGTLVHDAVPFVATPGG